MEDKDKNKHYRIDGPDVVMMLVVIGVVVCILFGKCS